MACFAWGGEGLRGENKAETEGGEGEGYEK